MSKHDPKFMIFLFLSHVLTSDDLNLWPIFYQDLMSSSVRVISISCLHQPRRLSHFAWKSVEGSDL